MEAVERFIRVLAFREDPSMADGGTGYVLSPALVLTAAHVVEGAWKGGREIRVYSQLWPEDGRPARVKWCRGARGFDAALLEIEPEERFPSLLHQLARVALPGGSPWSSKGFPRGGSSRVPLAGLKGEVLEWPQAGDWFELGADYPPDEAEDWSGISGATVLVQGLISGVIGEVAKAFPSRLQVTSLPGLLKDAEFATSLGLSAREIRCQRLQEEAEELLAADLVAAEALAVAGASRGGLDWLTRLRSGGVAGLIQAVCHSQVTPAVLAFNEAHRKLVAPVRVGTAPAAERIESARTLKEVSFRLFPLLQERSRTFNLDGAEGAVVPLPLRRETVIEFAVAGFHDRPAVFAPAPRAGDHPKAVASLGEPVFDGSIADGLELFRRFVEDLASAHADTVVQQRLSDPKAFREDLALSRTNEEAFRLTRAGQALRGLNSAFAFKAKEDDRPLQYYLILDRLHPTNDGKEFVELMGKYLSSIKLYLPEGDLGEDDAVALPFKSMFSRE